MQRGSRKGKRVLPHQTSELAEQPTPYHQSPKNHYLTNTSKPVGRIDDAGVVMKPADQKRFGSHVNSPQNRAGEASAYGVRGGVRLDCWR